VEDESSDDSAAEAMVSFLQQHLEVVDPLVAADTKMQRPTIFTNTALKMTSNEAEDVQTVFEIEDQEQLVKDATELGSRAAAEVMRFFEAKQPLGRSATAEEERMRRVANAIAEAADLDAQNISAGQLRLFNPSILEMPPQWRRPGERWIALFRFANYRNASGPLHKGFPKWYSSYIAITTLDSQLWPLRPIQLLGSKYFFDSPFDCDLGGSQVPLFGPEDARLFVAPGQDADASEKHEAPKVLLFFSGRAHSPQLATPCREKGGQRMFVSEIGPDLLPRWTNPILVPGEGTVAEAMSLEPSPAMPSPWAADNSIFNINIISKVEKNWSPFLYRPLTVLRSPRSDAGVSKASWSESMIMAEYSFEPHTVFDINISVDSTRAGSRHIWSASNADLVNRWRKKFKLDEKDYIHVGVNAVRLERHGRPDVMLSVLHVGVGPARIYVSFLYIFEAVPPFRILGIGQKQLPMVPRTCLWQAPVAFPMGLHLDLHAQQPEMWVLWGRGDLESHRLRLPWKEVESKYLPKNVTNIPGLTLIVMSHAADRLAELITILRRYRAMPPGFLEEIVVVWNDPSRRDIAKKIEDLNAESIGVTLRVVAAQANSTNNRFAIWESIRTEGVIIQDDDMWVNDVDLDRLISTWQRNREALVGARSERVHFQVNESGSFLQRCRKLTSKCTMLPRPWVVATRYLRRYMEVEAMPALMDQHPACDEIYFNGILANATGALPIAVDVEVQTLSQRSNESLSWAVDPNWAKHRAMCIRHVNEFFVNSTTIRLSEQSSACLQCRLPVLFLIAAIAMLLQHPA